MYKHRNQKKREKKDEVAATPNVPANQSIANIDLTAHY